MMNSIVPFPYRNTLPVQGASMLSNSLSFQYASVSTRLIEIMSSKPLRYVPSKRYHSTDGVHCMSLVKSYEGRQERSYLLTLERLTAVRGNSHLLPSTVAEYINILWNDAHTTEFFDHDDVKIVETAERIIKHGLRFAAPQAAGSC